MKFVHLIFLAVIACGQSLGEPPQCEEVDYSGTAEWMMTANSLLLNMPNIDLIGRLEANIEGAPDDSIRPVMAVFTGKFVAPLGERRNSDGSKIEKSGQMTLAGNLITNGDHFNLILTIVSGTDGFAEVSGYLELDFFLIDEFIYLVGTFCLMIT